MAKTEKKKATKRTATKRAPATSSKSSREKKAAPKPKRASKKSSKQAVRKTAVQAHNTQGPQQAKRPKKQVERKQAKRSKRKISFYFKVAGAVLAAFLVTAFILSLTDVFKIESVEIESTAHVSQEDLYRLADVPEGVNLLNINTGAIESKMKQNPWIESVTFVRKFPHALEIKVNEYAVKALVPISSTQTVWALSPKKTWIQPVDVASADTDSLVNASLSYAMDTGAFVITGCDSDLSPRSGDACDSDNVGCAYDFSEGFSESLSSQIVRYDVPNTDGTCATLKNGIEISLGSTSQLDSKEAIINQILNTYANQITFINVRNPAKPAYKKINADSVQPGTGTEGKG